MNVDAIAVLYGLNLNGASNIILTQELQNLTIVDSQTWGVQIGAQLFLVVRRSRNSTQKGEGLT